MSALSFALLALAVAAPAEAGRGGRGGGGGNPADLAVSIDLPVFDVDVSDTVTVTVDNQGGGHATDVWLTIVLPQTHTSPTVHPLGPVTGLDSRCYDDHTLLKCDLGRVRAGDSAAVDFDLALPWSAADIDLTVSVQTSAADSNSGNDTATETAEVVYPDLVITGPVDVINEHCTGIDLVSFTACTRSPTSISSHEITLTADQSIGFAYPGYTGSWSQPTDDSLHFEYWANGSQRLVFDGNAVDADCFEGLSSFPGSVYVAPYRVCLQ